ncbi:MAG: hypothetical protein ACLPSO_02575 [Terracidiphilus sp.]
MNIDDHRWIKEKTYISFGDALKISSKEMLNLEKGIKSGAIRTHYPMKPAVLQRIITAAKHSISLRPELVDLL